MAFENRDCFVACAPRNDSYFAIASNGITTIIFFIM